ncbi:precorrin-6A/cobalt-precorrin-6A reductase [Tropicibacter naphthalenivorans]|uniref:Precorrin-6A reductase n=1 Tax=Tropicibacter naphthalenivorans TaxID=441103 RepID=A0A0P1G532_9RHOB|nr:precorrin-6A/cobalt-precorrin-6A reductase [Tropicibacter naphthalenivorans]CUH76746.1 Precorrin-6A reductase [Tropicibacter naphthalenivorans]SMC63286.1 precorrin-6A/cobalt-precorrin-6A reductase [Tropicibacter naphthalenivorans]
MTRIAIIAGSAEARALARAIPQAEVRLVSPERVAQSWPAAVSTGALEPSWIAETGAEMVIEAAHPCDIETAQAAARLARAEGLPLLQLVRPAWRAGARDRWHRLRSPEKAAEVIPKGARVLMAAGRDALVRMQALEAYVIARRIGQGGEDRFPLRRGRFQTKQGPFTVAEEMRALRKDRIDWLLVHNAGGPGGWPKLGAARRLGLPVAMIDRPRRPDGPRVQTVAEALAWIAKQ